MLLIDEKVNAETSLNTTPLELLAVWGGTEELLVKAVKVVVQVKNHMQCFDEL
jgi:hypothetical protein